MKLTNLELTNYRNCANIIFDFGKNKTLIIGKNAQGKTNILESIYFLSCLKSPRTSNNTELIKFDENLCNIKAQISKNNTAIDLSYSGASESDSPCFTISYLLTLTVKLPNLS